MTDKVDYVAVERIVKDRKAIVINQELINGVLGFDDMRDFFSAIGNWGYHSDFTYMDDVTENMQKFVRAFLKSYLD